MKLLYLLYAIPILVQPALADTPAPTIVKARAWSGDGNTPITVNSNGSMNVDVVNSIVATITGSSLPTNACQESGGHLASIDSKLTSPLAVSGTFWQATQPVSAASLPLPAGAATSAKQPALGIAGTPSADVLTVQGKSGMTALTVDGSGVTQPVSGTVTANAGSGTFSVDASGHTVPVSGTFWQATQPVSGTVTANAGSGTMLVDGSGHTQPVSGALTANIGSTGGLALDTTLAGLQVSQGSTTSGQNGGLSQGATTTSAPTYVTGKTNPLSLTTAGALRVDGSGATQPVSGTVTANAGSGTMLVDGSGHTQPVSGTFWQATQPVSGTVTANVGTTNGLALDTSVNGILLSQGSTTSGQKGALHLGAVTTAAPSYTTGQSSPFSLNTSGGLRVDASGSTVPVSGTFWQATQPVSGTVTANAGSGTFTVAGTVTSNIGTTNGLALDASVSGLQVAQGSTTSGQSGPMVQGAVTTAAPSYTTAKTSPLSLTTAGALRVDNSAVTQPVSGTFWQATQPVSIATAPVLVAGSAIIGKVGIDQTTPGTTNLVALAANQSVNLSQIAGNTTSTGNGTAGTGVQRVTIASDNTAFNVNAVPTTPTAKTVKQAALSIGTTAVRLTNDALAPPSTRTLLVAQLLSTSTANCYFGASTVTTTSTTRGVQMFAGQTVSFTNDAGDYYAICDAASQTVYVTEQE